MRERSRYADRDLVRDVNVRLWIPSTPLVPGCGPGPPRWLGDCALEPAGRSSRCANPVLFGHLVADRRAISSPSHTDHSRRGSHRCTGLHVVRQQGEHLSGIGPLTATMYTLAITRRPRCQGAQTPIVHDLARGPAKPGRREWDSQAPLGSGDTGLAQNSGPAWVKGAGISGSPFRAVPDSTPPGEPQLPAGKGPRSPPVRTERVFVGLHKRGCTPACSAPKDRHHGPKSRGEHPTVVSATRPVREESCFATIRPAGQTWALSFRIFPHAPQALRNQEDLPDFVLHRLQRRGDSRSRTSRLGELRIGDRRSGGHGGASC